jgi:hypothetical protein
MMGDIQFETITFRRRQGLIAVHACKITVTNKFREEIMNQATKAIVSTFGVILGLAGMNHGFFEALQGNTPTPGLIIQAIGPANRIWVHGTEEAFSIIPNFLVTGILAMAVALLIMVWSVRYVQTQHGPTVFILLFAVLFLVGGGIGQIVFFLPIWAFAREINKPMTSLKKVLPENVQKSLAKLWPYTLTVASGLFLFALEIAIFGFVPGMSDAEQILYFCWACLGIALVLLLFTFVAGYAQDMQKRVGKQSR